MRRLQALNVTLEEFPVAIAGDSVFQGLEAIEKGLNALLAGEQHRAGSGSGGLSSGGSPPGGRSAAESEVVFSTTTVVLAGLADGINPCAFSTILFLISMLALAGRTRNQILTVGIVYTVVVFIGYFAVGLGLFSSVRALLIFPAIAVALRWVLIGLLVVLAFLSVHDAILAASGRTKEMTLQLSDRMKQQIHSVMRVRIRTASVVAGTVVIALMVTVFEFSCTGQIYVPVIMHLARTEGSLSAYGLLAAYNGAFILPLALVFGISYAGVAFKTIASFFSRRITAVKLLLAGVFLGMAVITLLT
jgi:cytochrome c biogenesis protein CcdA